MNALDSLQGIITEPVEGREAKPADPLLALVAANTYALRADELVAKARARLEGRERPVATPWTPINRQLGGGLWPGMHILVGATGSGKSQYALQVTMAAARAGVPVLILSLELDALGLFARNVTFLDREAHADSRLSWSSIYTGAQGDEHAEASRGRVDRALREHVEALKALPIHWVEAPPHGLPHTRIVELVGALRACHPQRAPHEPVLVVVDFLQLVAGEDPREDTISRISRASYALRQVARDHQAVVLALSSTSRENSKVTVVAERTPEGPAAKFTVGAMVGLGKESGDIEYSADSVAVLCREEWSEGAPRLPGGRAIWVAIGKVRAGEGAWHELRFDGSRFALPPAQTAWCETCSDVVAVSSLDGRFRCALGHTADAPHVVPPPAKPLTERERKAVEEKAEKAAEKAAKDAKRETAKKAADAKREATKKAKEKAANEGDDHLLNERARAATLVADAEQARDEAVSNASATDRERVRIEEDKKVTAAKLQAKEIVAKATAHRAKLIREASA